MAEVRDIVGAVLIGRNEGERLVRALAAVAPRVAQAVYVDSGSTDGSVAAAKAAGLAVVELDTTKPFTAARARNAGFEELMRLAPSLRYVQFIDGDCEIQGGWLEAAVAALEGDAGLAVVCGRRRERHPEKSVYNRLIDLEWDTPVGEAKSCGGDAMFRIGMFRTVGGFDGGVMAGEEPELCTRLRGRGWKVRRLDAEMTRHDADMLRLAQWWRREVRSGFGAMDVTHRLRGGGPFAAMVRRARVWTIGHVAIVVAASLFAGVVLGPALGGVAALLVVLLAPMQALRMVRYGRRRGLSTRDAMTYGALNVLGKWPQMLGQVKWHRQRGRATPLIEYKATPVAAGGAAT